MIAIVNVDKLNSGFGWRNYELRINEKVIAAFKHRREDGLAICLMKAAKAAELAKYNEITMMLEALK